MAGQEYVKMALEVLSCTQKQLAARMGVSPTQISKWKKGEHMSREMVERFRQLLNVGDRDPAFVRTAGSLESAIKWEGLIQFLANMAGDDSQTGYVTAPLDDEVEVLGPVTFEVLEAMGVTVPHVFPNELDFDYTKDFEECEPTYAAIYDNPYSSIILRIYEALNDIWGFFAAYVSPLFPDDETDSCEMIWQIESELIHLAASKIEVDRDFAPLFPKFRAEVTQRFEGWLNSLKDKAFRQGAPLKAELLNLVRSSPEELGHEAEAESLGYNALRLHPDIYMNELLCGMRAIHQMLPAIMKKIGIFDEFKLDNSEFNL